MKIHSLKSLFGTAMVTGALMLTPVLASAQTEASAHASVRVNHDGVVHIMNAEVTSVTGNLINAITRFKNTVVNWTFATNASTTINVTNNTPDTHDVLAGDHINVVGTVTTLGTSLGLNATSIKSFVASPKGRTIGTSTNAVAGTITSINAANGTFTVKTFNGKMMTVQTGANTTFKLGRGMTPATFATLAVNARVIAIGTGNASSTALVATEVLTKAAVKKDNEENKEEREDKNNQGEHRGFLKFLHSLNIGAYHTNDR